MSGCNRYAQERRCLWRFMWEIKREAVLFRQLAGPLRSGGDRFSHEGGQAGFTHKDRKSGGGRAAWGGDVLTKLGRRKGGPAQKLASAFDGGSG